MLPGPKMKVPPSCRGSLSWKGSLSNRCWRCPAALARLRAAALSRRKRWKRFAFLSKPDGRDSGAPGLDLRFVFAQLREVLTAEDSTPMMQEDNDGETLRPEATEPNLLPVNVGHFEGRDPAAERLRHRRHCRREEGLASTSAPERKAQNNTLLRIRRRRAHSI